MQTLASGIVKCMYIGTCITDSRCMPFKEGDSGSVIYTRVRPFDQNKIYLKIIGIMVRGPKKKANETNEANDDDEGDDDDPDGGNWMCCHVVVVQTLFLLLSP